MKISNSSRPLDPAIEISRTDLICTKVAPYLIGLFIFILIVLALFVAVKYGANFTGTEANAYQRLEVMV